ncbi:hypothetical protein [Azospirillum doebereinerae]
MSTPSEECKARPESWAETPRRPLAATNAAKGRKPGLPAGKPRRGKQRTRPPGA